MNIFEAVFLGILQGVGEFLPISSSAHLTVFPYFLNKEYQGLAFDVMLHMGTLLAILLFFRKDWTEILISAAKSPLGTESKKLWLLAAATIPAAILGLLFEKQAETIFRTPQSVGLSLIIFSFLIYLADKKASQLKDESSFSLKDALIIGFAQALAIIPGASRAGMTISAALFLGYKRFDAARISFLLSAPVILGAGILEIRKLNFADFNIYLAAAFISSFAAGMLSIKFLLTHLKKAGMSVFVIYRIILGSCVLIKFLTSK